MQEGDVSRLLHDTLLVTLKLGAPPLLAGLAVGLMISLFQAVTQINEQTLAFVPKVIAVIGVLSLLGPFMLATMSDYSHLLFDQMIALGGH